MHDNDESRLSVPPPVLDGARVLRFAVRDQLVGYSGRTLMFVDGKELGPADGLAICENLEDVKILLFHCDRDWNVLGAAGFASIEDAEKRAERTYPGISQSWTTLNVTPQQVSKYLEEAAGKEVCTFCSRTIVAAELLLEKNGKWICGTCLDEFQELRNENQT